MGEKDEGREGGKGMDGELWGSASIGSYNNWDHLINIWGLMVMGTITFNWHCWTDDTDSHIASAEL